MDSRYPEIIKDGIFFTRFTKPGWVKDTMSDWKKEQQLTKTVKAKHWLHADGREDWLSGKKRPIHAVFTLQIRELIQTSFHSTKCYWVL